MKIVWSLSPKSFPELQGVREDEQKRLMVKCTARSWRYWQTWAYLVAGLLVLLGIHYVSWNIFAKLPQFDLYKSTFIVNIVMFIPFFYLQTVVRNNIVRKDLVNERKSMGYKHDKNEKTITS